MYYAICQSFSSTFYCTSTPFVNTGKVSKLHSVTCMLGLGSDYQRSLRGSKQKWANMDSVNRTYVRLGKEGGPMPM